MNCCISAAGYTVPPLFCWETKKWKGEWTKQEQCKTYHSGTENGWSSAKVFKDWLLKVFVKHVDPKGKGGVVLFLDASSTHLTAECINVAREHGVRVVVLPFHQINHMQPLDVAIFKHLKAYVRKFQTNFMRECRQTRRGGTVTLALFVKFATAAWNEATSPVAICNGFRRCGLFPFSLEDFLVNIPQRRIQHDTPPPPPLEVEDEVVSLDTNDSPVKSFKDFGCQVTGKAINNETKNDPLNLRLGATVTSEDFFTAALELEKKQKEKEAKRKRKSGQGKEWPKRRRVEREEEKEEE